MARFFVLMALFVLPALVIARPMKSSFIVQGRVYCDTCRAGFQTSASTYIPGARVRLECRERESMEMTYSIDGMTDQRGTYKIPVPDDHENEICEMVLVSSPQMECATVVHHADRARVALTHNNGIVSDTRYANNLGFLKDAPMVGCSQLLKKYQEYDD
ncbi:pollen-specific protein [Cinnamomum micranthum f. kanehirae]|uniref:Pollen-specific protein n=1 Tax=Cinnamomum micranthum f. kanehirae TaxID=337451 RepID=A0A443NZV8_9MAGN|nr:pollen-specific protein [Cinnamomum micranthum f. kanehirae]